MLAQVVRVWTDIRTWGIADLAIFIVIVAAIIGIVLVAIKKFGITFPDWVVTMFWIVVVAVVAVLLIRLLGSM